MDEKNQNEIQEQKRLARQIERLLEDEIVDSNIRRYIFGEDDLEELTEETLREYRQFPLYMKNALSLTFYFSYACFRYDMDYGNMDSEKMSKHNSKRVIKSLKDAFVRFPATEELIQFVLTDIQFDLAQGNGELKDIFGDLSNRDMSRFSFNPYFKLIATYDKSPSRFQYESKVEMLRLLKELLETLTFLHNYELQQQSKDMFRFVCKNHASCEFTSLPLKHIFFQDPKYFGGIYHLFSMETREQHSGKNGQPMVTLRYFSGSNSITFNSPAEEEDDDASHIDQQHPHEVYMEVTGCEMALKSHVEQAAKHSNSIDQIHTVNYKYIKNLALAISDAISANAGSKEALHKRFSKAYPYIFQKPGAQSQQVMEYGDPALDWDTIVIMLLIEASPTAVLEHLMWRVPQTFYDIVINLYNRTNLTFFKAKPSSLDTEVQRIHDTKLIVGEAGGFGKIARLKPTGRLLARARAMFIISRLSMLQENEQDENLIYTGNLRSNISLLQSMSNNEDREKQVRYACIILSETLKHLICFYSGLYRYGEIKAEYDSNACDRCLSKAEIAKAQAELEDGFFSAAKIKAEALAKDKYEADRPQDALRLFQNFIHFCDSRKGPFASDNRFLYTAVGKYEIIDKHILNNQYAQLAAVCADSVGNAEIWIRTTLEILEYFKTGSFSDTPYDHDLFNTIYPFTAVFNRGKENPDGYKTVNFSLNIDIDNDNNPEYQPDINVLSEFSYTRSEVYYCLPNVIRSNYKWWIDPVLINFRKFNDIFTDTRKEDA